MNLGTQTVTLHRPGAGVVDDFGNQTAGPASEIVVRGCSVQPAGGDEVIVNRDQLTTAYVVWAPPTPRAENYDSVEYGGVVYELDGPVERWEVGTPLDHQVLNLRRVDG